MVSRTAALRAVVTLMLIGMVGGDSASAADALVAKGCAAHAPEAAVRSGIATKTILRVMRAESGGDPQVRSSKGAIGCMQIMPATWRYLVPRYGLRADPLDPRMNMIGGALYLAELARRFGWPGAFSAYNAGPSRYLRYVAGSAPLPAETVDYVARLGGIAAAAVAANPAARWQDARLFVSVTGDTPVADDSRDARFEDSPAVNRALPISAAAMPVVRTAPTLFPLSTNAARSGR